jgi:hypothetical protein
METNVTTTGALEEVLGSELEELGTGAVLEVLGAALEELGASLEEVLGLLVSGLLLDVLGTSLLVVLGAGSELLLSLLLWVCVPQATNIEVASNNVSNFLTFIKMPPLKNW